MNDDDLRQRLRAADPVATLTPDPSRLQTLVEDTMSTTLDGSGTRPASDGRRTAPGPRLLAAAAAVAALATAGVAVLGPDGGQSTAAPETLELALPAGDVMSSCLQYSVEILADMPIAFSATADAVGDGTVELAVDRWYRGGSADLVELENPTGPMTSIDGVEFTAGTRYLVTASQDGTVNGCGYTAVWSEPMARDFATAFGS
ncbi:MAG: hypothetical protein ACLGH4_01875 [Actinomycetes bacterium]